MVLHWSLIDSKSPQVSRTLLSILTVFNNAVIWVVSTRHPTPKSSRPFNNPLATVPKSPITIGIIVTFILCSVFNSLARSRYLSFFSYSFSFILWSARIAKLTILQVLFFLLIIIRSGFLVEIRWSICISKSHGSLCVSFSKIGAGLCIYHLFVWSNFNFLHVSQWITLFPQSCLVLCFFCANLLHSLILWLMVSSLSPYNHTFAILLRLVYSSFYLIIICEFLTLVSSTLYNILVYLSNIVVWMVSAHRPISNSSSPLIKVLSIVQSAPIISSIKRHSRVPQLFRFSGKV